MPKRRTHHKKTTHHRRARRRSSVHGVKGMGGMLMNGALVIGGVAVAGLVVTKLIPNQSEMIKTIVPIAAGVLTAVVIKSDLGKFAGLGMVAYGGSKLLAKAGIAGLGETTYEVPVNVAGDMSLIAGPEDFAMAGAGGYGGGLDVLAGIESMAY